MADWNFLKKPEFWVVTVIAIVLTFAGGVFTGKSYTNSIVDSPNSELNVGTKIEGDFTQTNSIANFGKGVTAIGDVKIADSAIIFGTPQTIDLLVSQNTDRIWHNVLFATTDCDFGLIKELPPHTNRTVAKCSNEKNCKILPEYEFRKNSIPLQNVFNQTVFLGFYFENTAGVRNIINCLNVTN